MPSHTHYLYFNTTRRQELVDITDQVAEQVDVSGIREGFVLVSAMHITASVFVNDHESGRPAPQTCNHQSAWRMALRDPRGRRAECVAHRIAGEYGEKDEQAREDRQPWFAAH